MDSLVIQPLDPTLEHELRNRAARHGLSVAEEAKRILSGALLGSSFEGAPAPLLSQEEVDRRVARVLAHGRKPLESDDWKALSDELWDFVE